MVLKFCLSHTRVRKAVDLRVRFVVAYGPACAESHEELTLSARKFEIPQAIRIDPVKC